MITSTFYCLVSYFNSVSFSSLFSTTLSSSFFSSGSFSSFSSTLTFSGVALGSLILTKGWSSLCDLEQRHFSHRSKLSQTPHLYRIPRMGFIPQSLQLASWDIIFFSILSSSTFYSPTSSISITFSMTSSSLTTSSISSSFFSSFFRYLNSDIFSITPELN